MQPDVHHCQQAALPGGKQDEASPDDEDRIRKGRQVIPGTQG